MNAEQMDLITRLGLAPLPPLVGMALLRLSAAHSAAVMAAAWGEPDEPTNCAFEDAMREVAAAVLAREAISGRLRPVPDLPL